ncbi:MAG: hypothetical protein COW88_03285 [Candidatus Lloydbacteria bacterium CG22_combo_CG10-13_8_21_14_all_47_15]|uniref:Uncharacterized protein n=1 Tax=Candidatus Lloydbacteria bacterium CG22_combo_CG10-13_8_21_14_all_47_15 TaxID=1974635 RepID=A0A2H0CTI0_9BACT|nr:MAG: hypothetical protein COW88_03285 [Candidatus Lloydbacteria bacterium CG22_combo_CG10-13_8_21_14_all_47_15]
MTPKEVMHVGRCLYCDRQARIMTAVSWHVYYICRRCFEVLGDRTSVHERDHEFVLSSIYDLLRAEREKLEGYLHVGLLNIGDFEKEINHLYREMQTLYEGEYQRIFSDGT